MKSIFNSNFNWHNKKKSYVIKIRDEQNIQIGDFIDRLREMKKENNPLIPDAMVDAQGIDIPIFLESPDT